MKLELCSYELALLAKDIGFSWPCHYAYAEADNLKPYLDSAVDCNGEECFTIEDIANAIRNSERDFIGCLAPELDLLAKYIREVHSIVCEARYYTHAHDAILYEACVVLNYSEQDRAGKKENLFPSYEFAMINSLAFACGYIKQKLKMNGDNTK